LAISLQDSLPRILDRQNRLGTLFRQLYVKSIEDEGRLGVVTHQGSQFRQVLGPELVQCRLEGLLANLVGLEKLRGEIITILPFIW
jgi:hypothetical protein